MVRLNEFRNGIRVMQRFVFQLKQSITDLLGEAKKLRGHSHKVLYFLNVIWQVKVD